MSNITVGESAPGGCKDGVRGGRGITDDSDKHLGRETTDVDRQLDVFDPASSITPDLTLPHYGPRIQHQKQALNI